MPKYSGIEIVSPQSPAFTNSSLTVVARLDLVAGRSRADPSELLLVTQTDAGLASAAQSLLAIDAGLFSGVWTESTEGVYQLVATWPDAGFSSAPLAVTVDRTPPIFQVTIPSPPNRPSNFQDPDLQSAWKRDEFVTVSVSSDDVDIDPGGVQLAVLGLDAGNALPTLFPVRTSDAGCGHPYCGVGTIDLSVPPMNDFNGVFAVSLNGRDVAGNASAWNSPSGLSVTRWEWILVDAGSGGPPQYTPAIGSTGTVYLLGEQGSEVVALTPQADTIWTWTSDAGTVITNPVVGAYDGGVERVYVVVASNGGGPIQVFALDGTDPSPSPVCTHSYDPVDDPALGTSTPLGNAVPVETLFLPMTGELLAVRPDAISTTRRCYPYSLNAMFPTNAATDGTSVYLSDSISLFALSLPSDAWHVNWSAPSPEANLLALVEPFVVVANGFDPSSSQIAAYDLDSGVMTWSADAGQLNGGIWAYGSEDVLESASTPAGPVTLSAIPIGASAPTSVYSESQIWGLAIGQDDLVYANDDTVGLVALGPDLVPRWSMTLRGLAGQPTLDCARGNSGAAIAGRPGRLYVGALFGILAVIVDSHGLSTTAAWPKRQHDARNTGNLTTSSPCP